MWTDIANQQKSLAAENTQHERIIDNSDWED
jgi:hypothetical protein